MLLAIIIVKSLLEISLIFLGGRALLGWLIGAKRAANIIWQILDIVAKPALWLTRALSPSILADRFIPLATASGLLAIWIIMVKLKVDLCLQAGLNICK